MKSSVWLVSDSQLSQEENAGPGVYTMRAHSRFFISQKNHTIPNLLERFGGEPTLRLNVLLG